MPIVTIANGEGGASVRGKLNDAITRANEVETARNGEASLKARIDAVAAAGTGNTTNLATKADKSVVDAILAGAPSNLNTFAEVDGAIEAEALARAAADALLVPKSRFIVTSGLLTGGDDLAQNLNLNVSAASATEAVTGASNTVVMTPLRDKQALDARMDDENAIWDARYDDLAARLDDEDAAINAELTDIEARRIAAMLRHPFRMRPGEIPDQYTHTLTGGGLPEDRAPISTDLVVNTDEGEAVRLTGATILTTREMVPLTPNGVLKAYFAVARETNSSDPNNDAVRTALRWFTRSKATVAGGGASTLAAPDLTTLTTGSGWVFVEAVISRAGGSGVIVPPASARFVRPYVETWGTTARSDVLLLGIVDVSDVEFVSPDLDALENRVAAQETIDAGNRLVALESAVSAPEVRRFQTRTAAAAATIGLSVDLVETFGFYDAGDGGGALYKRGNGALPGGFTSVGGDGWELTGTDHSLMTFGAKGDGPGVVDLSIPLASHAAITGTNDSTALQDALAYAALQVGMKLRVPARHFMLDASAGFTFPGNFTLAPDEGAVWDTRRRADFSDAEYLFRTRGQQLTANIVLLTHDVKPEKLQPIRFSSVTHDTGVITAVSTAPHGLVTGDLFYMEGDPADDLTIAGYYHVNKRATGRTIPGVVTVLDPTTFTYAPTTAISAASLPSNSLFNSYGIRAADVVRVASTAAFKVGDRFLLASQAEHRSGVTEINRIGEQQRVALVLNSTMLRLTCGVREAYLTSDTAKIVPLAPLDNVTWLPGLTIIGKGADVDTGSSEKGDKGLHFLHVHGLKVDVALRHFDLIGGYVESCVDATIRPDAVHDFKDTGGRQSGDIDISYPWTYGMACERVRFLGGKTEGGRHSISQNGGSSATLWGICRAITIEDVSAYSTFIDAFSTHQGVVDLSIINCRTYDCGGGANIRFARGMIVRGNNFKVRRDGLSITNHFGDITFEGNTVEALGNCFSMGALHTADDPPIDQPRWLRVRGNTLKGGHHSIFMQTPVTGTQRNHVDISDNTMWNPLGDVIYVDFGGLAGGVTDGWSGVISGNTVMNGVHETTARLFTMHNARGVKVYGNSVINDEAGFTPYAHAFYWRGAGSTGGAENDNEIPAASYVTRSIVISATPGTFSHESVFKGAQFVSADASFTWSSLTHAKAIVLSGTLTASRVMTLTPGVDGETVEISRSGGSTGGPFSWFIRGTNVVTVGTLAVDKTGRFVYDAAGGQWVQVNAGNRLVA